MEKNLDIIYKRRSIRIYQDKEVSQETLKLIITGSHGSAFSK